jgi:hypothetical protein
MEARRTEDDLFAFAKKKNAGRSLTWKITVAVLATAVLGTVGWMVYAAVAHRMSGVMIGLITGAM